MNGRKGRRAERLRRAPWLLPTMVLFLLVGCASVYQRHGYGESAFYCDPHLFWQKGVGRVTCFERDKPETAAKPGLIYPVPCRSEK